MPTLHCETILFDLDGVLVDSSEAIERSWREWALRHALDPAAVLSQIHGHRSQDTIARFAPHLDAAAETARFTALELTYIPLSRAYAGAQALLDAVDEAPHAVVTSGSRELASARLSFCELPIPVIFVTADDVTAGKPSPEGYLLAARRLAVAPQNCVVIEDSTAGVQAAKSAGMRAIAVTTTHPPGALTAADHRVPALDWLVVQPGPRGIALIINAPPG